MSDETTTGDLCLICKGSGFNGHNSGTSGFGPIIGCWPCQYCDNGKINKLSLAVPRETTECFAEKLTGKDKLIEDLNNRIAELESFIRRYRYKIGGDTQQSINTLLGDPDAT